jgi:phosphoglycolate phosphatase
MNPPWSCILFDLDGTIVDSAPGIIASLAWTLEQLGRPVPTPAELLEWVGPPILDSFRDRGGMTEPEAERALDTYRPHYLANGALDSTVYPGVADLMRELSRSPIPLSLATSKPESLATVMLEHFDLDQYFDFLTGASEDEVRSSKADVVAEALRRIAAAGHDISNPVLVGDRHYDVLGAAEHGVPTIFVGWGYGAPEEAVGTLATAKTPVELRALLLAR